DKTVASGQTWFYSRSRQCLWKKGETSGHIQAVQEIRYDCDQDTLLVLVEQTGAACHTGHYSCFYRTLDGQEKEPALFDAAQVYQGKEGPAILLELMEVIRQRQKDRPEGSYTTYLFNEGIDKILKKVGEESAEVIIAAKNPDNSELIYEVGDMIYHLLVLLVEKGVDITEIFAELRSRR
ncbi:MAG: bifunctional phosphoribosyl-AMP cyclohydrolase/phosphoribosyl-ATP diphosphatase HisIE, partial [Syntrophomonadaceae bacterium]